MSDASFFRARGSIGRVEAGTQTSAPRGTVFPVVQGTSVKLLFITLAVVVVDARSDNVVAQAIVEIGCRGGSGRRSSSPSVMRIGFVPPIFFGLAPLLLMSITLVT